jgi:hypothetical protein
VPVGNAYPPSPDLVVYRIIDRTTEEAQGSYSRACHDEYDFHSARDARDANCHGVFENRTKYRIDKYRVVYELIEEDCDNPEK